jgi:adenylate cyclase
MISEPRNSHVRQRSPHHGRRKSDHRRARVFPAQTTERKFATVVFADVQGSMNLSAACGLEEWWSVIAGLFELMSEAVDRFGGWVADFTGDGIFGVFEASGGDVLHAHQACAAALWLRHELQTPVARLRERGLGLAVRIGINSGDVVTGTIGHSYSRYYTANGFAVGLAKRMETLALPDQVYLSEHTAALVSEAFELRDLGGFHVKGADLPVGVFELVGSR